MKAKYLLLVALTVLLAACSPKVSTRQMNAYTTVTPNIVSYNELTMDIDPQPITYTIDISTREGKMKLKNLSVDEACDLVLLEAIMANRCATFFQPQYTYMTAKGKVLRVSVYGFPARYKRTE